MALDNKAGAWRLLNVELESGWKVIEPVGWDPATGANIDRYNGTGGHFSVAYIVERGGRRAFLKAIDLTTAITAIDVLEQLNKITSAHSFEARMLKICEGEHMDRVVIALESGQVSVGPNLQDKAPYLIFELAKGDVRRRVQKLNDNFRLSWWLRAMHHTAVGLSQLHAKRIAHQDLKPSNILSFGEEFDFRIADLGRSVCDGLASPHDELLFSGDFGYAPPEILYGRVDPEWTKRRLGCDLYMFGSMIFFFATGFGCTQQLIRRLEPSHRPQTMRGMWTSDFQSILPMLQNHFTDLLVELEQGLVLEFREPLVKAASELCNPDPTLRGHPLSHRNSGNPFSLERYVSTFDRLAKMAEVVARSKVAND